MGKGTHSDGNAEGKIFENEISPIIECLNVEFETGVFVWCNNRVMIRRALRWMDSNERDCSADIDECQRGRHIQQPGG